MARFYNCVIYNIIIIYNIVIFDADTDDYTGCRLACSRE